MSSLYRLISKHSALPEEAKRKFFPDKEEFVSGKLHLRALAEGNKLLACVVFSIDKDNNCFIESTDNFGHSSLKFFKEHKLTPIVE
ncbi:MAG: hypothetical protein ABIA76_01100 [Candidatus Diapherotrites archaeon]